MSIGTQLKQAREAKGISVQEVSSKIKIQNKFLIALENDNISALPNLVYAKGFLKKYAEFLGLDTKIILDQLQGAGLKPAEQVIDIKKEELPPVRSENYLKKIFIGILGFLIIVGCLSLLFSFVKHIVKTKRPSVIQPKKIKKPVERKIIQRPKKTELVKVKSIPPVVKQVQPNPAPAAVPQETALLILSGNVKKPCHISIKSDGKLVFEDFLLAGANEQWHARQEFELNITDVSAVDFALNGKRLNVPGRLGRKNILIGRNGIKRR